jgi:hypothetical protein
MPLTQGLKKLFRVSIRLSVNSSHGPIEAELSDTVARTDRPLKAAV